MKTNCWESKQCGRQPGGERVDELGVCPAATSIALDGANGGQNGGRACWVVAGTLCRGAVQGTFARKFDDCKKCDFYGRVRGDEGPDFSLSASLLARLVGRHAAP